MGVRDDQKQATREKVLEAARDLFNDVGYEETTIRAIAERAGVELVRMEVWETSTNRATYIP